MTLGRADRLKLFYERLRSAPAADSFESALSLISKTLDEVEDEHSGEPNTPEQWMKLKRMFPPQPDRIKPMRNRPGVHKARSFKHYTLIGSNGSFEIWYMATRKTAGEDILEVRKFGADGKGLPS